LVSNGKLLQELSGVSFGVSLITGIQISRKPVNLYNQQTGTLLSDDVDLSAGCWTRKFLDILEKYVPQKDLTRCRNLPWLTRNVVRHMRKRNSMFLRAKRSKNPTHFAKYRNEVTMMLQPAKQNYFNMLTSANSKQFGRRLNL